MNIASSSTPQQTATNLQVFNKAPEHVTGGGIKKFNLFIWKEGPLTFATLSIRCDGGYSSKPFKDRISGGSKSHVLDTLKNAAKEAGNPELHTALQTIH